MGEYGGGIYLAGCQSIQTKNETRICQDPKAVGSFSLKTYCPIDNSKMIAISRQESACKEGCQFNGNLKELWSCGVTLVFEDGVGYLDIGRLKAL